MAMTKREWVVGGWKICFTHRSPGGPGRFGGYWGWKVGAQWSKRCVLVSLLLAELRFDRLCADERKELKEISRWARKHLDHYEAP